MKKIILLVLPFLALMLSCDNSGEPKKSVNANPDQLVEIQVAVEGMTCGGCENTVNTELLKLSGVSEAKASHVEKNVVIKVDTLLTSLIELETSIERVGYTIIND